MENFQFDVIPLFSSPLGVFEVKEDLSNLKNSIQKYKLQPTNLVEPTDCYVTENFHILEDFPKEKNILKKYFYAYKNNLLKMSTTEFEITTSWFTKTAPSGRSEYHKHTNSVYSGVFYFEDFEDSDLEFACFSLIPELMQCNSPTEWNVFNSKNWKVSSYKNRLVFFPSYLYHRIGINKSQEERYSLAFNLFPVGSLTNKDSSIELRV